MLDVFYIDDICVLLTLAPFSCISVPQKHICELAEGRLCCLVPKHTLILGAFQRAGVSCCKGCKRRAFSLNVQAGVRHYMPLSGNVAGCLLMWLFWIPAPVGVPVSQFSGVEAVGTQIQGYLQVHSSFQATCLMRPCHNQRKYKNGKGHGILLRIPCRLAFQATVVRQRLGTCASSVAMKPELKLFGTVLFLIYPEIPRKVLPASWSPH